MRPREATAAASSRTTIRFVLTFKAMPTRLFYRIVANEPGNPSRVMVISMDNEPREFTSRAVAEMWCNTFKSVRELREADVRVQSVVIEEPEPCRFR